MQKALLVAAVLAAATAVADERKVETLLVTGTRLPLEWHDVIAAVTVINRQQIEQYQADDVLELLNRIAGISFVRNGGRGAATALSIRGNQSDHSLFLIDGVRIGSATLGLPQLAVLSTSLINRIEIIRGPKSALYGADAIGGVVNIITRRSRNAVDMELETAYGSNNTTATTALAGANSDAAGVTVTASVFDTDGIDNTEATSRLAGDDDAFRNNSYAINGYLKPTASLALHANYSRHDSNNEYDSNCTHATTFAPLDCLIYSTSRVKVLTAGVQWQISEALNWTTQGGISNDELENRADNISLLATFNGGEFYTRKREVTSYMQWQWQPALALTAGLDYQLDAVQSSTAYNEDSRYNKAAFVQAAATAGELQLNASVRHDDNQQFGSHTTTAVESALAVTEVLKIYASYGEGFKAPTFNDLYWPGAGNPDFVPEVSKNTELGLRWAQNETAVAVAVYKNRLQNLIQYNPALYASDQTAEAQITGLELALNTVVWNTRLHLGATLAQPVNRANNKLLRRRAKRKLTVDVDRNFGSLGLGASLIAESRRFDDAANNLALGGYATVALRSRYNINKQWAVKLRVNNLFNKHYATAVDFALGQYPALGREYFIAVVYKPDFQE